MRLFLTSLFCCRPGNHCHSYLMRLTSTLAGYIMSILPQVPIHGWLGSRAEDWEVWLGWFWLLWLLLPRWDDGKRRGWKPEKLNERKHCTVYYIYRGLTNPSHHMTGVKTVPVVSQTPPPQNKRNNKEMMRLLGVSFVFFLSSSLASRWCSG